MNEIDKTTTQTEKVTWNMNEAFIFNSAHIYLFLVSFPSRVEHEMALLYSNSFKTHTCKKPKRNMISWTFQQFEVTRLSQLVHIEEVREANHVSLMPTVSFYSEMLPIFKAKLVRNWIVTFNSLPASIYPFLIHSLFPQTNTGKQVLMIST